jgi:hypothetical protein
MMHDYMAMIKISKKSEQNLDQFSDTIIFRVRSECDPIGVNQQEIMLDCQELTSKEYAELFSVLLNKGYRMVTLQEGTYIISWDL